MKIIYLLIQSILPIKFHIFGAAIQGAFNLAGSAIDHQVQKKENERAREWAEEMRDYDNWYNSPEQQIQRLKNAGLNPAMLHSNPTAGGTAVSAPSPNNYGKTNAQWGKAFASFGNMFSPQNRVVDQQLQSLDEDVKAKKIANERAQIDLDERKRKIQHDNDNGVWQTETDIQKASLRKMDDEHDIAMTNLKNLKNKEQREQMAENRLQELHQAWQQDNVLNTELKRHESEVKTMVLNNEKLKQQVISQLNKDGFDPNTILAGDMTYAKLEAVISSMSKLEQYRHLTHQDKINEIKRILLPATALPGLGKFVEQVIDYLDTPLVQ